MSRLIIKHLPHKTTEEKLRKSFDSHGIITDVQLKFTKEGKFRHFAFIGYKTEDEAQRAQKYTNNTYAHYNCVFISIQKSLGKTYGTSCSESLELSEESSNNWNRSGGGVQS